MELMEINEALKILKEQGWNPMVCDTPVPLYTCGVPAGPPKAPGDYDGDYILLPRELVGYEPVFTITVKGTSMEDANLKNGDQVFVKAVKTVEDGEIVVVMLDGEATMKAYYRDENGEAWLVPQNDMYHPMKVSEFTSAHILGVVVGVKKNVPRVSFRAIQQQMRSVKQQNEEKSKPDDSKLRKAIATIARQMTSNRQWFSVYRILADKEIIPEHDFYALRDKVNELLPDNDYNINPKDLSKLDVDSFSKRLFFWEENDAPVQGKRFYEYLNLANAFKGML